MKPALVTIPIHNEAGRLDWLLERLAATCPPDLHVLFVDDASTDATPERIFRAGFEVLRNPERLGCGRSVRVGLREGARRGHRWLAVMAGNGKDDPQLLDRVLAPLRDGTQDFVQGSRYLPGGAHEHMPLHRKLGTRAYSLSFTLLAGRSITDATNGFRALDSKLLSDPRIQLEQDWLDGAYEVETYLFFQAIRLGYRVTEVPVSKRYPSSGSYTKMQPFSGWWSHFRPALLLRLGLRS